jgi:hypothetical protein
MQHYLLATSWLSCNQFHALALACLLPAGPPLRGFTKYNQDPRLFQDHPSFTYSFFRPVNSIGCVV